ncbi:MAG: prolipoprotein diacylglyceryl transferase, partial [Candidatus Woesearchaeota archaeon]
DLSYFLRDPASIVRIWEGGIASHGAMLGGLLALFLLAKHYHRSIFFFTDPLVIILPLSGALIRIGNFINSELVGRITTMPWGVLFRGYEGYRHPVQLYEAALLLVLFGIMLLVYYTYRFPFVGLYTGIFFLGYGIIRMSIEFYKDYFVYSFGLTLGQLLTIPVILFGSYLLWKNWQVIAKQQQARQQPAASQEPEKHKKKNVR